MSVILDKDAPSTAVIEFATLSPFGMELIGESFHYSIHMDGWTPFAGIDHAITAMGWQSTLTRAKDELKKGPAFVEPVEMGHLRCQPGMKGTIGADPCLVALRVDDE
ncbi:hypothetical protein FQN52_000671 [Onygenales sp. PD_12]|nr:hypothetical protein FQN52_000671 [Onygenales sp. PD_12]